jgi:hypothetical protein
MNQLNNSPLAPFSTPALKACPTTSDQDYKGCVGIIGRMPKLLILTDDPTEHTKLLQQANLPGLEIFTEFNSECDIVFGDIQNSDIPQRPT